MKKIIIFLALIFIPMNAHVNNAPAADFGVQPVQDNEIFYTIRADRLEYQWNNNQDVFLWDVEAWIGSDYNKLYLRSEGDKIIDGDVEEAPLEIFYSRAIHPFWDLQMGVRHDFEPHPTRTFAAFGVEGLARYWFDVKATAYVSEDWDVSANFEAEYDLLITQRLIFQPRFAMNVAVQEVPEYNIGSGIDNIELGARLRFEIRREFAPYIGISWNREIGETADLVEADGGDAGVLSIVAGVKLWF
jgi:copper resistance protein B